jgi:hypothetical protein
MRCITRHHTNEGGARDPGSAWQPAEPSSSREAEGRQCTSPPPCADGGSCQLYFFVIYTHVTLLYSEYFGHFFQNAMPGRAGGSRGSAPSTPYLNEARPATISPEGLSGRRGAPTGA